MVFLVFGLSEDIAGPMYRMLAFLKRKARECMFGAEDVPMPTLMSSTSACARVGA